MKKIRMIFSDLDGTLLNQDHQVSERTCEKVRQVQKGGTPFVLISSRSPDAMLPIKRTLGIEGPIVSYGGALILDEKERPIHSMAMERQTALAIHRFLTKGWAGIYCGAYVGREWFIETAENEWTRMERLVTGLTPRIGPLDETIAPGQKVHKVICQARPEEVREMEEAILTRFDEVAALRSAPGCLEITHREAVKSKAVHLLCARYGIDVEETVSFGDNYNDVAMLRTTGLGVAMGNAPGPVKAQAGAVTLDNDHDGVCAMLETLVV